MRQTAETQFMHWQIFLDYSLQRISWKFLISIQDVHSTVFLLHTVSSYIVVCSSLCSPSQCRPTLSLLENSVLLSSRPYSWSRVVSRPNLPALVLVLVLLLNKTMTLLISTVRSQPQSCDYILYITETHCPCFDMHARFSRLHAVMELYLYFALNYGCTDIVDPEL